MPPTPPATPVPSEQHVLNCQFSKWHPIFKHCTPRSVILELAEDVVQYLQQDGVVLPKGFEMSCGEGVRDDSDDEVDWGNDDDEDDDGERVSLCARRKMKFEIGRNTNWIDTL